MRLSTERTALVVVDMQNSYLRDTGSFVTLLRRPGSGSGGLAETSSPDPALLRRCIAPIRCLIDTARHARVPVIYLQYVYRPDYRDGGILIREINPCLRSVGYVADGTWDAEIVEELAPRGEDFIVKKARYSGFHSTMLETILRSLDVETLIVCGVTTHFCVEATARDAHMRDYRVVIVSDATEEVDESWKQMTLASFVAGFGWVLPVDDVVASWKR